MSYLPVLAQRPLVELTGPQALIFLAIGMFLLAVYLCAVFALWLLMRRLSRRAALIVLGSSLVLHLVTLTIYLIANPQIWEYRGAGREIIEALAMPLWLTIPLVAFSLIRLLRK